MNYQLIALFCLAYFLGAIPFGLIISAFKKIDLRAIGSGNIGASNVYRALGIRYATIVFLLDALKGYIPTLLALNLFENPLIHILVGITTIFGHSLTIFAKFKGGKGAATGLGVLLALAPDVFVISAIMAALIIYLCRYVSVATICCSVLVVILLYFFDYPTEYVSVITLMVIFIIYRHKANIKRLRAGEENKV